jgi:hypothetical protein
MHAGDRSRPRSAWTGRSLIEGAAKVDRGVRFA